MLHGSMHEFPDLYFVFLTNSPDQFEELVQGAQTQFETHRHQNHYKIIRTGAGEIDVGTFGVELTKHLNTIPLRIMAPFCRNGTEEYVYDRDSGFVFHEDYVSPNVEHRYRIATAFLHQVELVQVTVSTEKADLVHGI